MVITLILHTFQSPTARQEEVASEILSDTTAIVTSFGLLSLYMSLAMMVMHHQKNRFAVLALTLSVLLVPSFVGFFLAITSPAVIVPLVFCICGVFVFAHMLARAVSICGAFAYSRCAIPHHRRFQAFAAFWFLFTRPLTGLERPFKRF